MASAADICNLGLANIGHAQPISALSDRTKAGAYCARFYPQRLDDLLALREWPFARRIQALPLSSASIPGWSFAYSRPVGCVRLVAVCDAAGARSYSRLTAWGDQEAQFLPDRPFQQFDTDAGTVIATDVEAAYGVMNWRVEDVSRFPPLFRTALGWMMAASLAGPLEVDAKLAQSAAQQAEIWMERAAAAALNESGDDPPAESPSIRARG